ncbi:MAG: hypothetical protein K1000chlam1_01060 [Candidatus Anoxychlamydiales bacterium]|nr:hypothetical protein [Candidatus Anoxychlamydiales bacterium]
MEIRNERLLLKPKIENKKSSTLKILNPEALKKINSIFNKANNLDCSACDTNDFGCDCEMDFCCQADV